MAKKVKKIKFEWETITEYPPTYRAKVFGGWKVTSVNSSSQTETSIFVPDPNHEWEIEND